MKVYFDLDGVLADFGRGVLELLHQQVYDQEIATKESDDALWAGVRDCPHFYDRLEPMPGAVQLFRMAHDILGEDCQILSAIPKPHRGILSAAEDKINWVHRLFGEDIVVNIVYRAEKKNFCTGPDCILVDDMQKNVTEWETCGGTGIVFRDAEEALHKLRPLIMLHNKNDGVDNIWFETMEDYEEVEGSFIQKYGANDSLLCIIINGVDFCDAANDLAYDKNTPLPAYTHNTVGWVSEDLLDIYRCPAQRKRNTTELLTCSECGEPGCTTIMPSIRQDENYVYWEKLRQVPGGKTLDFSFCFDKTDYKEALDDLDPYVDYEDASGDVSEALVEQARMIAAHAHRNQVDKAGKPYIGHLTSVAELVVTNKEKCVALMHDLFEDTDFSYEIIRKTFGNEIYQAVLTMTHREDVPYLEYVRNIRKNPLARAVKLADLTNNMDLSRLPEVTEKDLLRVEKYRQALQILLEEE